MTSKNFISLLFRLTLGRTEGSIPNSPSLCVRRRDSHGATLFKLCTNRTLRFSKRHGSPVSFSSVENHNNMCALLRSASSCRAGRRPTTDDPQLFTERLEIPHRAAEPEQRPRGTEGAFHTGRFRKLRCGDREKTNLTHRRKTLLCLLRSWVLFFLCVTGLGGGRSGADGRLEFRKDVSTNMRAAP